MYYGFRYRITKLKRVTCLAKTNTERQFNYRNEKIKQGEKRLEIWLSQDHFDKFKKICDIKRKSRTKLIGELIDTAIDEARRETLARTAKSVRGRV